MLKDEQLLRLTTSTEMITIPPVVRIKDDDINALIEFVDIVQHPYCIGSEKANGSTTNALQ